MFSNISTYEQDFILQNFNSSDEVYLDHAGATIPSISQLEKIFEEIRNKILSNPQSRHSVQQYTSNEIDFARALVLNHFNASVDDYDGILFMILIFICRSYFVSTL